MNRRRRITLGLAAALVLSTVLLSSLALVALNAGGEARLGPAVLMRVSAGYDRRARPLLAGPEAPSPAAAREAVDLSHRALSQYPYDTAAWLQLAYVDATQHDGRLTPAGIADLQRSYDLVAADPSLGVWRVGFALENWPWLPLDLRTAVATEASALMSTEHRDNLRELHPKIRNPVGRLTLGLWLSRLELRQGK